MSKRRIIPRRPRIYVGCEGKSEVAYVGLIRDILERGGVKISLVPDDLSSGDPLSRVGEAKRRATQKEIGKEPFTTKFVLLDADQGQLDQAEAVAQDAAIFLVWQRPCHEGLLLRHFAGHQNDDPPSSALAGQALNKLWPEYQKPMEKRDLARRLDIQAINRAAAVEDGLTKFLRLLGWPDAY